ncbi:MAG: aminopeptidase [Myxococcales bacterium]|nr:aminopeptidase [Polyangiaceae bacterium]MDW8248570.1 aminopeptidase [Myxococcales bacterium]
MRRALSLLLAASLAVLQGCGGQLGMGYLVQAAEGQFWLLRARRPIEEAALDPSIPEGTRALLAEVPRIKQFGERQGLKATSNYAHYVDVGGPAVTWVVSACDPLSFRPVIWRFPIIGAITYVGWFDRDEARAHAERLRAKGLDVDLRGAGAYSTLGWLPDPVLSSMLHPGEGALGGLVDVVLHESVHATYYLNGQSFLNESLATFVARRLTRIYLRETRGAESRELRAYEDDERRADERRRGLHKVYEELDELYQSPRSVEEKLARKKEILDLAQKTYGGRPLNNAVLIQYRTYGSDHEDFEALLTRCGGWPRFWEAIRSIDKEFFERLQQEDLKPVLERAALRCGP